MLMPPTLLLKMFLDPRQHHGRSEFRFRPHLRRECGRARVDVRARDSGFAASIALRPGTSDVAVFEQVFLANDYNLRRLRQYSGIMAAYRAMSAPLVLDLGANIGLFSLYAAKNFPRAKIVAIEPEAENFALLAGNTAGFDILPLKRAVASQPGRVDITNPGDDP